MQSDKIVLYLFDILKKHFYINKYGVMLFDNENNKILYKKLINFQNEYILDNITLLKIFSYWKKNEEKNNIKSEILVYDELKYNIINSKLKNLRSIMKFMENENISIISPLNRKVQLNGILLIGTKLDKSAFSEQEVDLIENLIANVSVSMGRAILYQEVNNFNITLNQKVSETTNELCKNNKRLQIMVKKLKDSVQRERDMIDIMGHELRTPLTIIKNSFELVNVYKKNKNIRLDPLVQKQFEYAQDALLREISIVETLLKATKIDSNKLQLNTEKVDMKEVLKNNELAFKNKAISKGLKLIYKFDKNTNWFVKGDRISIQQICDNFVSNAVKYTNKGDSIRICVRDTGEGIKKENIPNLGKKFYRINQYLDNKQVVRPGGTGLGLYVSFNLIKNMYGKYDIISELGKGSNFCFELPKYIN